MFDCYHCTLTRLLTTVGGGGVGKLTLVANTLGLRELTISCKCLSLFCCITFVLFWLSILVKLTKPYGPPSLSFNVPAGSSSKAYNKRQKSLSKINTYCHHCPLRLAAPFLGIGISGYTFGSTTIQARAMPPSS